MTRACPSIGRHLRVVLLAAAAMSIVPAQTGVAQEPPAVGDGCLISYVIGPGDVLDIAVWDNTEITRTVPVRPDGKISLPVLNDVTAAGFTPMQLREMLTKALAEYIPSASVSVLVREVHSFKVSIIGEVKTAGRYELHERASVLDVLAMAGGLTEYAARGRIVVLRQEPAGTRQIPFPYDKLTARNRTGNGSKPGVEGNLCLHPGDVVLVP